MSGRRRENYAICRNRSAEERAEWVRMRRRGAESADAVREMEATGYPARSAQSWGQWEWVTFGRTLRQLGEARRYVVRVRDVPLCWGSISWCAGCLGLSPDTIESASRKGSGRFSIDVERVMCAPCEMMDGAVAPPETLRERFGAWREERRSRHISEGMMRALREQSR